MRDILMLANDVTVLSKLRLSCSDLNMISNFSLIDSVLNLDIPKNENIDMGIVGIANRISNLDPSLKLTNGTVLTLYDLRAREKYAESEVEFILDNLTPLVKPFIKSSDIKIHRAIKHLLTGCEVTSSVPAFKSILHCSLIVNNTEAKIALLCGYAIKFDCKSVQELASLFSFYYPDRLENTNSNESLIRYQMMGKTYSVSVRY